MARLSADEKKELIQFSKDTRFVVCNVVTEVERLKILHSLKEKGLIRFKGNQGELQFYELIQ